MSEESLRLLPKMDVLLAHPLLAESGAPRSVVLQAARETVDALRAALLRGETAPADANALAAAAAERVRALSAPRPGRVINATGVVLHTNLGRAPLSQAAARAAYEVGRGYCDLEYDAARGQRGSRHAHVEDLVCALTGAEAALALNNNAAAVLLMLAALCRGKRVAVSRGELVEIGGGFRVPDIMAESGAHLVEVGTTNKTRLADYEAAEPEALLKVHTSNYEIVGFTEETPPSALAALAARLGVPFLYDLGSGALSGAYLPTLPEGPTVRSVLAAGADVVCFSGDKLLGGPQAGIALGKKTHIDAMKRHPLARCVRIDKLSLAALEATLRACRDPEEALRENPVLSMLSASAEVLEEKAHALAGRLAAVCGERCAVSVLPTEGQVGGGAMPSVRLPSFAVALTPAETGADALGAVLRAHTPPIVGRIYHGRLLLDVRTVDEADFAEIAAALRASKKNGNQI